MKGLLSTQRSIRRVNMLPKGCVQPTFRDKKKRTISQVSTLHQNNIIFFGVAVNKSTITFFSPPPLLFLHSFIFTFFNFSFSILFGNVKLVSHFSSPSDEKSSYQYLNLVHVTLCVLKHNHLYIYNEEKKNLNSEHQDRETSRVRDLWFSERNESLPQTFLIYLLILFKLSLSAPSMYQKENATYISTHEIHALKTWCQKLLFTIHWYLPNCKL